MKTLFCFFQGLGHHLGFRLCSCRMIMCLTEDFMPRTGYRTTMRRMCPTLQCEKTYSIQPWVQSARQTPICAAITVSMVTKSIWTVATLADVCPLTRVYLVFLFLLLHSTTNVKKNVVSHLKHEKNFRAQHRAAKVITRASTACVSRIQKNATV